VKNNNLSNFKVYEFSVVMAAYNCAQWIDETLNTLIVQTIGFQEYIQLIIVDDGSTDQTFETVQKWVIQYPDNIILLYKENGGPSSARNWGLKHAIGKWVTFIDADDFVNHSYFQIVYDFLENTQFRGSLISCNLLLYFHDEKHFSNSHALNYKFIQTRIVDLFEEPIFIQLSLSSCFIRHRAIQYNRLKMDERINPTFEDAHFLNVLLLREKNFNVAFLKEAQYFYRRRGITTGLVEGGWAKPTKYHDQILFGYLNLVQQYHRALGYVPVFVQNLILYESHWYMERLLNGLPDCKLSDEQQASFFELMRLVFRYIDAKQILLSKLPALELRTRIAMLKAFKGASFFSMPLTVADVGPDVKEAQLQHWSTEEASYSLRNENGEIAIPSGKRITHRYGSEILCHEYRCWVPLHDQDSFWPEVNGLRTDIFCRGRMLDSLTPSEVSQANFLPHEMLPEQQRAWLNLSRAPEAAKYRNVWLIMDRVHNSDDSAEHFCRWLMKEHPEQPIRFVLDAKSQDWKRLEREGFPLVVYRSREHYVALGQAHWLVSSHVDLPVIDPMGTRTLFGTPSYKVAFLQHGIIKEDLSGWLNQVSLDCMVTSTRQEYDSIINGRYKITERELVLAGLPRHDALLRRAQVGKPGRTILVCPTWREHLRRTEAHIPGLNPEEARGFQQSDYFRRWNEVTGSRSLARLARENGYRFLFLPHPEVVRFLPLFKRSEAFLFISWTELKSVQDLIASCAMAVTDYSSIVFDIAFIGRPVAYYQFPETPDLFSSQRRQGYFSFYDHGMGPVLRTPEELESWIRDTLHQDCVRQEPYNSRADAFFTLRDGQNCRRVHEAIMKRSR
jgi:glycosyltransferase involved in cell wall biosynthesis/CDP-glycerol glycerophosphotransferase (TagB/SpsB family)